MSMHCCIVAAQGRFNSHYCLIAIHGLFPLSIRDLATAWWQLITLLIGEDLQIGKKAVPVKSTIRGNLRSEMNLPNEHIKERKLTKSDHQADGISCWVAQIMVARVPVLQVLIKSNIQWARKRAKGRPQIERVNEPLSQKRLPIWRWLLGPSKNRPRARGKGQKADKVEAGKQTALDGEAEWVNCHLRKALVIGAWNITCLYYKPCSRIKHPKLNLNDSNCSCANDAQKNEVEYCQPGWPYLGIKAEIRWNVQIRTLERCL